MSALQKTLQIETSPHLAAGHSVDVIMRNVVYALIPVCAWSVYAFGISVLLLLMTTTLTCMLTEALFCRLAFRGAVAQLGERVTGRNNERFQKSLVFEFSLETSL